MASQALLAFFATLNRSSLGVVSNNPGNLVSNSWTQSLPGYRSRNLEGFAVFATPGDGIDALQLNLRSYGDKGLNTPFKIASAWAPEGQPGNDPIAYAETIAKQVGVGPYAVINLASQATLDAVTMGIMLQENGTAAKARFAMGFSIDPNVKGYINLVVAVCGVIATIGVHAFPDYLPAGAAADIVQTAALIFAIYGGLNTAGNFLSSSQPGLLAPPDPPVVVAAQAVADLPKSASPVAIDLAKLAATNAVAAHVP
jgi:hypothetical protein